MEQNFKPSLYLQAICEMTELTFKQSEESTIASVFESFQNEKIDEVAEWINEVDKFLAETQPEFEGGTVKADPLWCYNTISKTRKLRAKRGPNFSFRRASSSQDVGSEDAAPLSLREELSCELTSLLNIYYCAQTLSTFDQEDKFSEDLEQQIDEFLTGIKLLLQEKNPEKKPGWYRQKISETKAIFDKCEPAFSLQSQDVEPLLLHEELRCEIRSLIRMKLVDMLTADGLPNYDVQANNFKKDLYERINEVNKFLAEIKLQLVEKIPEKNFDWYNNKIAETRMLIVKRYSEFPLRSQDVGYTREHYQIFLSFRGEDTRYGFTGNLYNALHQEAFNVFMDDRGLERGDSISQVLMGAIENSKLSIIIFSKNFADSPWCLDEVVKILECKQKKNQLVWPVFYKLEPSVVRHQIKSYGEAMIKHETRYGNDVVRNWRSALHEVCGFNAFPYKKNSGYVICLISITFI